MFTDIEKQAIYEQVRANVLAKCGRGQGQCLEFAMQTLRAIQDARGRAVRAILQAGTAGWPYIADEDDDGVMPTHFTYMWDDACNAMERLRAGMLNGFVRDGKILAALPEIHIWVALPQTGEIIDMATGFWPEAAKEAMGVEWQCERPPAFLWATAAQMPARARYEPSMSAIQFVLTLLRQITA
jgi:hypothetical protein